MSAATSSSSVASGFRTGGRQRARVILFIFVVWGAVIVMRLAHFMLLDRDRYLAAMTRESLVEGTIPALRGRLLDREGRPLAWSTRHFRVEWHVPDAADKALAQWRALTACAGLGASWSEAEVRANLDCKVVVNPDLTPAQAAGAAGLCDRYAELQLQPYFVRHKRVQGRRTLALGKVRVVNGTEIGVSGAEKDNDSLLRGRPGGYKVMRDRNGHWMPETWHKTREIQPGYDVYLPVRVPDSDSGAS